MTIKRGRNFLMTPGPTPVPERILQAMARQPEDIADPRFRDFALGLLSDMRKLFETEHPVFLYAANGHGAWEAALANTLSPGDLVLLLETGTFAPSWANMARALGLRTELIAGDWRRSIDPSRLEERLRQDKAHEIKAVLTVQTDTATSINADLSQIRPALDAARHPALLMADVVASLLTTPFPMDDWGFDVAVGGCQKGLMMPPGLSFTAAGPRALAAGEAGGQPRRYWDWRQRQMEMTYLWFSGTAPTNQLYGLREALDMVAEEGLPAGFARHQRLAEAVRRAVSVWSEGGALDFSALEPAERANAVTTILVDDSLDASQLIETCRDRFDVALGQGYDRLEGRAFRIGHMGYTNEPTILGALGAVEATLKMLQIPHGKGALDAAIDHLAETAGPT